MTDLFLGLGMLFMVFDDSRARTERLAVINKPDRPIARTQQLDP